MAVINTTTEATITMVVKEVVATTMAAMAILIAAI
jgi:hypothetical protein